jgi:hypothetical protein
MLLIAAQGQPLRKASRKSRMRLMSEEQQDMET